MLLSRSRLGFELLLASAMVLGSGSLLVSG
jgi:hypothetical protein